MADPNDQFTNYYPGGSPPSGVNKAYYPGGSSPRVQGIKAADRYTRADMGGQGSTALNMGALLALADTEPERNPRNEGGEVLANLYRRLGRLENRTGYLEQNS